jgi:hypothetical protein
MALFPHPCENNFQSLFSTGILKAPAMAPTTSDEFDGDDFSNNLFSDLAPLLTLFGEQVTKQFLSMSMGWADNVLLAMGPLVIITTVVSAIRVGGGKRLKALIGRYDSQFQSYMGSNQSAKSTRKPFSRRTRAPLLNVTERLRDVEWPTNCATNRMRGGYGNVCHRSRWRGV